MSVCENVTSATLSFSGSQQVKEKKKKSHQQVSVFSSRMKPKTQTDKLKPQGDRYRSNTDPEYQT